jgi:hypothetical protein
MSKKPIKVYDIDDALARLNSPHEGDKIIVQALPLIVPTPSYALAITSATIQLLINEYENSNAATSNEGMSICKEGQYEVVVVFHVRRTGAIEYPVLN